MNISIAQRSFGTAENEPSKISGVGSTINKYEKTITPYLQARKFINSSFWMMN